MYFRYDLRAVVHELLYRPRRKRAQGPPPLAEDAEPWVTVLCVTNRPARLADVVATFQAQTWVSKDLHVVANAPGFASELLDDVPEATLVEIDESVSLGACLNAGLAAARGELIVRIDDDELYAPDHVARVVETFRTVDADVVGKCEYFAFVEARNLTVKINPGRSHRYVGRIAGGTLAIRREVRSKVSFPDVSLGEDGIFVRRCERAGFRVWAGDPRGFLQIRRSAGDHTWRITDDDFTVGSQVVGEGRDPALWC